MRSYEGCTLTFLREATGGNLGRYSGDMYPMDKLTHHERDRWLVVRAAGSPFDGNTDYRMHDDDIADLIRAGTAVLSCPNVATPVPVPYPTGDPTILPPTIFASGFVDPTAVTLPPPVVLVTWDTLPEEYRLLVTGCPSNPIVAAFVVRLFKKLPPEPLPITTDGWKEWINTQVPLVPTFTPARREPWATTPRAATTTGEAYYIEYTTEEETTEEITRVQTSTVRRRIQVPLDIMQEAVDEDDLAIIVSWIEENHDQGDEQGTDWGDSEETDSRQIDSSIESTNVRNASLRALLEEFLSNNPREDEDDIAGLGE